MQNHSVLLHPFATATETVLLVDDDGPLRRVFGHALTARGYQVIEATDGEDALALAGSHNAPIHLVISDVVMPEMDGNELFRHLRAWYPAMRFIFISGYLTSPAPEISPDGRTAYLAKPLRLGTLLDTAEVVLRGQFEPAAVS
jgi:two-component system cell cycle sensor histidine kinase/response regulator CckA